MNKERPINQGEMHGWNHVAYVTTINKENDDALLSIKHLLTDDPNTDSDYQKGIRKALDAIHHGEQIKCLKDIDLVSSHLNSIEQFGEIYSETHTIKRVA